MTFIEQSIRASSQNQYGARPPAEATGELIRLIPAAVRHSVAMAFRGRSAISGHAPGWLEAASDVRFVGVSGDRDTLYRFAVPALGEAAEVFYRQTEIWPSKPPPTTTGFELLGSVLHDVRIRNEESDLFDTPLLRRIKQLGRPLKHGFSALVLENQAGLPLPDATVNSDTIQAAESLWSETPASRQVRVVGTLDMVRVSTQTFALRLDDGTEVRGVPGDGIKELWNLLAKRVAVMGKAVFRPSGRLLRVDAEAVEEARDEGSFFSRTPKPAKGIPRSAPLRRVAGSSSDIAAFFGTWPGEESDEELLAAVAALRR